MKTENKKNKIYYWIIGLLLVLIVLSTIIFIKMPKRECSIKLEMIRVDLPHWDGWTNGDYFFKIGDKVVCETGVVIDKYSRSLTNFNMVKNYVCLIKTETKECVLK